MDRGSFIVWCLLGLAIALAVFLPLGAKRRAHIPPPVWWLCTTLGIVACLYGLFHSTAPSFAARVTAVGNAYDHVELRHGRDTYYGFRFVPDSGKPVNIETAIVLPDWNDPAIFNGRSFRIVYLKESDRVLKNEAIDIEILSGEHVGFHGSLDARATGAWLWIPAGAAFGAFGFFGLRYRKDDVASAHEGITDDVALRSS
jgi:hypothetical protein